MIFVFGSNLAGIHGAGSAKEAYHNYGAKWGQGIGLQGNSYAIPTKDKKLNTLSLQIIDFYVNQFKEFAFNNPQLTFQVVKIGCGLAGYKEEQIKPMFKNCTKNVFLPPGWNV